MLGRHIFSASPLEIVCAYRRKFSLQESPLC